MTFIPIAINAARICDDLSKIGYTPANALCDIIDNSVQADATKVWVHITRDTRKADSAKNNVREYTIIDNGRGMSEDGNTKIARIRFKR
jgi:DNA mismatch repair ATPase MutL